MTFRIDYILLASPRKRCSELAGILSFASSSLVLEKCSLQSVLSSIYCDISRRHPMQFFLGEFHWKVFKSLHNVVHLGVGGSHALLGDHFVWLQMRSDYAACSIESIGAHRELTSNG